MGTSLYINGRTTQRPGAYVEIDDSAMAGTGLGALGIVALVGEVEGGAPYTEGVHRISTAAKLARVFRGGDLVEAGKMAFAPSRDDLVPAGASELVVVKVNPATISSRVLLDAGATSCLLIESLDWGVHTTRISLEIEAGAIAGKTITIAYDSTIELYENVGAGNIWSLLYTPGADGADVMTVTIDPAYGAYSEVAVSNAGLDTDYVGTIGGILGLDGHKANNITASAAVRVSSSSAADVGMTVTVYGVSAGLPSSEVLTLNGTSLVTGTKLWATVHGFVLSAACAGTVTLADNSNSASLFVATTGQTARGVRVFTEPIEAADAVATVVADAAATAVLIVVGTNHLGVATLESVTLNGTTPVVTTTRWRSIAALAVGYVPAARTLVLEGFLLDSGDVISVVSSNAGDTTQTVTIYGLDSTGLPQSEVIALNGTTPRLGVATWSKVLAAVVSAAHAGTVSISGPTESVAIFSLLTGDLMAGFVPVDRVAVSGTLSAVLSGATTPNRDVLLVGLAENSAAQAEKITTNGTTPVAGTARWSELTGLAVGHLPSGVTLTVSGRAWDAPLSSFPYVQDVIDRVASLEGWTATPIATGTGTYRVSDLDHATDRNVRGVTANFGGDLGAIVQAINESSGLVRATKIGAAENVPANIGPVFLAGGSEGVPQFADWQAALDLLRTLRINTVVPLTDDAAVHAAADTHAAYCCGIGRSWRDVKLGAASGETLTQLKTRSLALNTRRAQLCAQDVTRYNSAGVAERFPPFFTAALAAGMQSGAPVGEPLTNKLVDVIDVHGNDSSYTIVDDGEELIDSGLLMLDFVPNRGWQWLRGVTTYQGDDVNLARIEASTNHAVNVAAYEFWLALSVAVGRPGFAGTVAAVFEVAVAKLTDLCDPSDGKPILNGWRNLVVEQVGDVLSVDVDLAAPVPINFIPIRIHLIPSQLRLVA